MIDTLIWKYKDEKSLELPIDNFIKTQISLCLLGMEAEKTNTYFHNEKERKETE